VTTAKEGNPPWFTNSPAPREASAEREACLCAVCRWCRNEDPLAATPPGTPVRPDSPEWPRLLRLAQERTK
jgi:hypothetical protein